MYNSSSRDLTLGALFIAMGIILPILFHTFSQGVGIAFSPMHLPIIVSALFLPLRYTALVGALTPLLSSLITGMPQLLPMAPLMMLECVAYALVMRLLLNQKASVFSALLIAMVAGRLFYILAAGLVFADFAGKGGITAVIIATFSKSWAAMALQLIVVPLFARLPGSVSRKGVKK